MVSKIIMDKIIVKNFIYIFNLSNVCTNNVIGLITICPSVLNLGL